MIGILGAGIAGLIIAYELQKKGIPFTIIESENQAGGKIGTTAVETSSGKWVIEKGPATLRDANPILNAFIDELGLSTQVEPASMLSKKRFILKNQKLVQLPENPFDMLNTPILSLTAKMRVMKEPFVPPLKTGKVETVKDFFVRRFGQEPLDYIINPFVAGIYAGNPDHLAMQEAFPTMYRLEQEFGSVIKGMQKGAANKATNTNKNTAGIFSIAGGKQNLIQTLANKLQNNLQTQQPIKALQPTPNGWQVETSTNTYNFSGIVLTIPPIYWGQIDMPSDLKAELSSFSTILYPPLSVVALGYDNSALKSPLQSFGFLVPQKEPYKLLGVQYISAIFPKRAPQGKALIHSFVGGMRHPEIALLSDEALVDLVHQELNRVIGLKAKPEFQLISRWKEAIPQFDIHYKQHREKFAYLAQKHKGLYFAGSYIDEIGVPDLISKSIQKAEIISKNL